MLTATVSAVPHAKAPEILLLMYSLCKHIFTLNTCVALCFVLIPRAYLNIPYSAPFPHINVVLKYVKRMSETSISQNGLKINKNKLCPEQPVSV